MRDRCANRNLTFLMQSKSSTRYSKKSLRILFFCQLAKITPFFVEKDVNFLHFPLYQMDAQEVLFLGVKIPGDACFWPIRAITQYLTVFG